MDKIFNSPKTNVYGGVSMLDKYIYMKREDVENKMYFIYHIKSILKDSFPITYECIKSYILIVPKDKNKTLSVIDNVTKIELTNNDMLHNISVDEFLGIFKIFVECQGTKMKITDDVFEK